MLSKEASSTIFLIFRLLDQGLNPSLSGPRWTHIPLYQWADINEYYVACDINKIGDCNRGWPKAPFLGFKLGLPVSLKFSSFSFGANFCLLIPPPPRERRRERERERTENLQGLHLAFKGPPPFISTFSGWHRLANFHHNLHDRSSLVT